MLGYATLDAATKKTLLARLYRLTEETALRGWQKANVEALAEIGQRLLALIVPAEPRSILFGTSGRTITLDVQDHDIPWELLHDGNSFLGSTVAVGRHLPGQHPDDPPGRPSVHVLVVGDPEDDLRGAADEARYVETSCTRALESLGSQYGVEWEVEALVGAAQAKKERVLLDRLLNERAKVDIFHYAGHANFDPRRPD